MIAALKSQPWPEDDFGTAGLVGQVRAIADLVTSSGCEHPNASLAAIATAFRLAGLQIEIEMQRRLVLWGPGGPRA